MGRPSVKAKRREEILDAYETCVALYGVEGASLEKVAEKAGLARPLIRHNIGNRAALTDALVARYCQRSDAEMAQLVGALPATRPAAHMIDWLFDPRWVDPQRVLVAEALIAAGQQNPDLAQRMRDWTMGFTDTLQSVLARQYPDAQTADLTVVATGIAGIYFSADSLAPLGAMSAFREASRKACHCLLAGLEPG